MKRHNNTAHITDLESLAADAKALLSAKAGVAEDKVIEARERLSEALERGKETWSQVQERAVEGAKATDHVIRKHPYQTLGIALGVGALLGIILARRN